VCCSSWRFLFTSTPIVTVTHPNARTQIREDLQKQTLYATVTGANVAKLCFETHCVRWCGRNHRSFVSTSCGTEA
jgi:hypothetical protein